MIRGVRVALERGRTDRSTKGPLGDVPGGYARFCSLTNTRFAHLLHPIDVPGSTGQPRSSVRFSQLLMDSMAQSRSPASTSDHPGASIPSRLEPLHDVAAGLLHHGHPVVPGRRNRLVALAGGE